MAEGLARHLAGDRVQVSSAGAEPSRLHPLAIAVMDERGIDIRKQRSKYLDEFLDVSFDEVITVCDRAARDCPIFPGRAARHHWSLPDPAEVVGDPEARLASFREVRDDLERRLGAWLEDRM